MCISLFSVSAGKVTVTLRDGFCIKNHKDAILFPKSISEDVYGIANSCSGGAGLYR